MERAISGSVYDVLRERLRQIDNEGYDREHDREHDPRSLAMAAAAYLAAAGAAGHRDVARLAGLARDLWPFEPDGFKADSKGVRRCIVIGAALALAALDAADDIAPNTREDVS